MLSSSLIKKIAVVTLTCVLGMTSIVAQDLTTKSTQQVLPYEVKNFKNEKELVELLNKQNNEWNRPLEMLPDLGAGNMEDSSNKSEVSTTNVQVEGVDEADVVKFTDKAILSLNQYGIKIIDKNPNKLKVIASITPSKQQAYYESMYSEGNQLIVLGKVYGLQNPDVVSTDLKHSQLTMEWYPYYSDTTRTLVEVYDLTNPATPVLKRTLLLDGNLLTTRLIKNKLYVITNQFINSWQPLDKEQHVVTPSYYDSLVKKEKQLSVEAISYPVDETVSRYTLLAEIDLSTKEPVKMKSFLGNTEQVYMSHEHLYLSQYNYGYTTNQDYTSIVKYDLAGLDYQGGVKVPGRMLNAFAMDEYKNYLRIATTTRESNHLFILDDSLNLAGELRQLAVGETIYAAKFMGDMAYLVTFEQIDPLFAIDVSNPKAPKVLGELKVPGYSNYLHSVGESLLLGVGYDTIQLVERYSDGTEVLSGIRQGGVKVSLFDVGNAKAPKEVEAKIYPTTNSSSEVTSDYKAFYFDEVNKVVGIPVNSYDPQQNVSGIWFMKVGEKGLTNLGITETNNQYDYTMKRIGYIDNAIYVVQVSDRGTQVIVLDRLNHKKIQQAFF